ncbi:hypothetical protein NF27_EY01210 [Candidatus Jidaibacter acanthamoeba]|uniref:Uncharacterized protein n=1 Tax=Candidatus Jidaibacter acanthamoebae TaxID=86105 RepID=A0A0C1QYF4_9RICK|nr:hypothetical protein NF27_EY01210 [Candidatus Jidaibacter acanthamoeba]
MKPQVRVLWEIIYAQSEELKKLNNKKNFYKALYNRLHGIHQGSLSEIHELNQIIEHNRNIIYSLLEKNNYEPGENMENGNDNNFCIEKLNNYYAEEEVPMAVELSDDKPFSWRQKINNERTQNEPAINGV